MTSDQNLEGVDPNVPDTRDFVMNQTMLRIRIELTHNWGTEDDADFAGYHDGNQAPQGFGHIGLSVPDVRAACERFEALGVEFQKRPDDGRMKGLAFIRDPDGYWIEILQADTMAELTGGT